MRIVAIFAHPDDEAFGPAGTIYKLAKKHDVYLLCATRGEMGQWEDARTSKRLGQTRAKELRASAKLLGVKKVYFLGFTDGSLCNKTYHKLAKKIRQKLDVIKPKALMTFEPRGISGHLDHVAVSMATSYVFERAPYAKKLMHYCITEKQRKGIDNYFIYFPPGYKKSEIDETVDISKVWKVKKAAMRKHVSQRSDAESIIARAEKLPKREHFLVRKKQ